MARRNYHKYLLAKKIIQHAAPPLPLTKKDIHDRIVLNIDPWQEFMETENGNEYKKFIKYCGIIIDLYKEKKIDETSLIELIPKDVWPEEHILEVNKVLDICHYLNLSKAYEKGKHRYIKMRFPNIEKYYDKLDDLISILSGLYRNTIMKK